MALFYVCRTREQLELVRWDEAVLVEAGSEQQAREFAKTVVLDPKDIRLTQSPWAEQMEIFTGDGGTFHSEPYPLGSAPTLKVVGDAYVEEWDEDDVNNADDFRTTTGLYTVEHAGTPQQTVRGGPKPAAEPQIVK
jgi:hypothetical protein